MGLKLDSFPLLKKIVSSKAILSHFSETVHLEVLVIVWFYSIGVKKM
jgi:hypothetical protein